jgi:hypothetical protein
MLLKKPLFLNNIIRLNFLYIIIAQHSSSRKPITYIFAKNSKRISHSNSRIKILYSGINGNTHSYFIHHHLYSRYYKKHYSKIKPVINDHKNTAIKHSLISKAKITSNYNYYTLKKCLYSAEFD